MIDPHQPTPPDYRNHLRQLLRALGVHWASHQIDKRTQPEWYFSYILAHAHIRERIQVLVVHAEEAIRTNLDFGSAVRHIGILNNNGSH